MITLKPGLHIFYGYDGPRGPGYNDILIEVVIDKETHAIYAYGEWEVYASYSGKYQEIGQSRLRTSKQFIRKHKGEEHKILSGLFDILEEIYK
jgi:hypothetical protein